MKRISFAERNVSTNTTPVYTNDKRNRGIPVRNMELPNPVYTTETGETFGENFMDYQDLILFHTCFSLSKRMIL
jgi:hypothetical protein